MSKFKLDVKNIVSTIARDAENKGSFEDAAMLYDLADVRVLFYQIFYQSIEFYYFPKMKLRIRPRSDGTVPLRYETKWSRSIG